VRGVVDTKLRERLPVDVVQGAGRGLAGEMVHSQRVGVVPAHRGESACVPAAGAAAEQQVEAWLGQRVAEPAPLRVFGDARVGQPVVSLRPSLGRIAYWGAVMITGAL
jgi:hypothetical protein